MKTLPEYITEHGDEKCAALFGVKARTVASWRRCENFPRARKASEIVSLTNNEVTIAGIYCADASYRYNIKAA